MRRTALLSMIIALVVSMAAPTGAVFALETPIDDATSSSIDQVAQDTVTEEAIGQQTTTEAIDTAEIAEVETAVPPESSFEPLEAEEIILPDPVIVTPPSAPIVSEPVTTPPLIITTFDVSDGIEFIELYNQSSEPIDLSSVRLQGSVGVEVCSTTIAEQGYILPGEFFYARSPSYLPGHFDRAFSAECLLPTTLTRLELFIAGNRVQLIDGILLASGKWGAHSGAWSTKSERKDFSSLKQAGSFVEHYILVTANPNYVYSSSAYIPPISTGGLEILEIMPNARSCAPDDPGFDCEDFIKVHNSSDVDINLAPFRIRTGSRTANATTTSSYNWHEPTLHPDRDELVLPAGEYFTLRLRNDGVALSLSNAESNVWIEDYYGVQMYQTIFYKDMDLSAANGKSWAYDKLTTIWQFGIPSPDTANVLYVPQEEPGKGAVEKEETLTTCDPGQYRSEETNRCRNIVTASVLTPCREGQYRSEETNRCRSIASTVVASLSPCGEDQFRNPETNRCKKIASAEDIALADCGENRERNPETNRCRNAVVAGSLADTLPFPVEKTEPGAEQFAGWWTLAIIAAIGAAYGVWEWRVELIAAGRRAGRFITHSK